MAPQIRLSTDSHENGRIALAEVIAPQEIEDLAHGEPTRLNGRNTGDTAIRNLSVVVDGEGRSHVQLAANIDGEPGVWADVGGSIIVVDGNVAPGDTFSFWARGIFRADDAAGHRPFEFVFKAVSIG